MEEELNAPRAAAAAAVLTGVAGLAVLGAGTASADEWDDQGYGSSSTSQDLSGDTSMAEGDDLFADSGLSPAGDAAATFGPSDEALTTSGAETTNMFTEPEPELPELDLPELDLQDPVESKAPDLELPEPADLEPTATLPAPVTEQEPLSSGPTTSDSAEVLFGDTSLPEDDDLFADSGLSPSGDAAATFGPSDEALTTSGAETTNMFTEPELDLPELDLPELDLPELDLQDPVESKAPDLELPEPADLEPTATLPAPVTEQEPLSSGPAISDSSEVLFGDTSMAEGDDLFADSGLSPAGDAAATFGPSDEALTTSGSETTNMFTEPELDLPELSGIGLTTPLPALVTESARTASADGTDNAAAGPLFPDLDLPVAPTEADAADDLEFLAGPGAFGDGSIGLTDQSSGLGLGATPDLATYGSEQAGSALDLGLGGTTRTGDESVLGLSDPTTGWLSGGELSFGPPNGADETRARIAPPTSLLADGRPVDPEVPTGTATTTAAQFDQAGIDILLDDPLSSGSGWTDAQLDAPWSATSSIATGPDGSQADPAAFGVLPEDLGRLLGQDRTGRTNLLPPGEEAVTGFGISSTGGFRLGTGAPPTNPTGAVDDVDADPFGFDDLTTPGLLQPTEDPMTGFGISSTGGFRLGTGAPPTNPTGAVDDVDADPFGFDDLSSLGLLDGVGGTGSATVATGGAPAPENPWRITTFDEENWPPRLDLEGQDIGYAVGGILPTIGLTANQRRIASGTNLLQELPPSAMTVPRSFASDILLGSSPIEVFEGDLQNEVAKSFVSGGVITALDEVARTAQNNLPEIQRRNAEFWANRGNRPNQYTVTRTPGTPQLASGLARPTIFAVAPTVTALNLGADALTDHFNIDPEPTDRNNNRYYGELFTDALATGAGVFLPIFGENYATGRAAALRAGTPVPKVGNIAAQTALAFGLPALQRFGAGVLAEEPPDKNDPIYRNTRRAFQFVADNATRAGDAAFGQGDVSDGNGANATRAVGNATATLATPVLDAVGGIVPNAFTNLRHQYDYLTTGERRLQAEPVVSEEAVASAEASRARTQGAWEAAREGDAQNRLDDLAKLGANGLYAVGRGGIGLAHSVVAPFVDPFQSEESRFFDEPTQAQRGQESFGGVQEAWQEAGQAVNGLLGRFPAQQPGSSHPTCGGDVTNECIDPRSLRDDDHDGEADNRGVLIDNTIGAPAPGTSAYQDCYTRGECGDQSVPGSPRYGQGPAGVGLVGPRIPANPTFEELRAVYSTPEFARHVERSFAAQPVATPPPIVDPVRGTVDRGVQAARNTAGWVGDRADDAADAAQRLPVVGGAVGWLRNHVPGLGGDGDPNR